MGIELKDLPEWAQAQVLKQIQAQGKKKKPAQAGNKPMMPGMDFGSMGEYVFYMTEVVPKLQSKEIVKCEAQPRFILFEATEIAGIKLGAIRYTADFRLEWADGTTEIVEVKSKFVRRMQRDYPLRRRIFLENFVEQNHWKFREVISNSPKEAEQAWAERRKNGKKK